jgi:hypothetical protein
METYRQETNFLEAERSVLFTEFANSVRPEPKVKSPKYTFGVASDYVVVGHDPEFADFDNPRGEIIRERFFMVAEDAKGYRFAFGNEESEQNAEFVFVQFAPAVSEWNPIRPSYGSLAYIESEQGLSDLRDEMEFDLGPDWENHPQVSLDLRTRLVAA